MSFKVKKSAFLAVLVIFISTFFIACSNNGEGRKLQIVDAGSAEESQTETQTNSEEQENSGNQNSTDNGQNIDGTGNNGMHAIFNGRLGVPISRASMGIVDPDPTGLTACNDYDGDGILNDNEISSNPYVADYPKIVTRISAPITMEIRVSETTEEENFTQTLTESDVKDTITNSMEDKHYTSANQKTTPYETKESLSESGKQANSYGYSNSYTNKDSTNSSSNSSKNKGKSVEGSGKGYSFGLSYNYGKSKGKSKGKSTERTRSNSTNRSVEEEFAKSTMAEKTVFEDVDYVDNLDRNGIEFTSNTVQNMVNNYRKSTELKKTEKIGPNAGVVRASLFIKNLTVNMPVKISNVKCTLSFRTPGGQFLPVKTFFLKEEDFTDFSQEVYGDTELGPFVVEIANLNTREVRIALANGYVPQIHVVSYDMQPVEDSNYEPGVKNLKIVEETAKARTATIKVIGAGMREIYRVAAFDVEGDGQNSAVSPGISIKKALFNIFHDRIGDKETWATDSEGNPLTVLKSGLKWKAGALNKEEYVFSTNKTGNKWNRFETYVKTYVDENNQIQSYETIKRIGELEKYNPFNQTDNETYNANELLSKNELLKMKFWVIMHNGRYFDGDINDPIWAGERYEIVCMDMRDFNEHFTSSYYTPFQSRERIFLDTRWNQLTEEVGDFARAIYLGKAFPSDVIRLEVDLLESRFLFDENLAQNGFGNSQVVNENNYFYNFNYKFENDTQSLSGIPGDFTHEVLGDVNNIRVSISDSENAHKYLITFYPETDSASAKTIEVTRDQLEKNYGVVMLSSQTPGVGSLPGNAGGLAYVVDVKAVGERYGITVSTKSKSRSQIAYVFQANAEPKGFVFDVNGDTDQLNVTISNSNDAEYYIIRYTGPYNYNAEATPVDVVAYAGYNCIKPPKPTYSDLEAHNFETGLFKIEVFARNANLADDSVTATNGVIYAEISYDRYENQKIYAPHISNKMFDLSSVDLEVNFNDGSGWFKLQAADPVQSGIEQSANQSEVIDCFYSSYMEQNKQRFFIDFMPPRGQYNGVPNVFFGGREHTEVYIRTIPKKKYRDTFWMRPSLDSNNAAIAYSDYNAAPRYLSFNYSLEEILNITDHWLEQNTDAANIEESLSSLSNSGIVSSDQLDDYFFSPKEQRLYTLKASVTDELQITEGYRPSSPAFTSTPPFSVSNSPDMTYYDNPYIIISGISAAYASGYDIYYVLGTIDTKTLIEKANADATGASWINSVDWINSKSLTRYETEYKFENLIENKTYTFCVAARNKYGVSIPTCQQVVVPARPLVSVEELGKPVVADINIMNDGILLTGISAYKASGFKLFYKNADLNGDDVDSLPWKVVEVLNGQTSVFIELDPAVTENILVRLFSLNGDNARSLVYWEKFFLSPVTNEPRNYSSGAGSFMFDNYNLVNIHNQTLVEGTDFVYGQPLNSGAYNIFDTAIQGLFDDGKVMRIVANGENIVGGSLQLTPIAMDLTNNVNPAANEVYIDPCLGKFVLPRPIYWNKLGTDWETNDIIGNNQGYHIVNTGSVSYATTTTYSKFGQGIYCSNSGSTIGGANFYFLGNDPKLSKSGTISVWLNLPHLGAPTYERTDCFIRFGDISVELGTYSNIGLYGEGGYGSAILVNNSVVSSAGSWKGMNHLYIVWDQDKTLDGGKSIRVYMNGVEKMHTTSNINVENSPNFYVRYYHGSTSGYHGKLNIDNLKIWDQVVSEDPSFEYNNGSGREDALHVIYGSANGYKPQLTETGNGVSYYYTTQP